MQNIPFTFCCEMPHDLRCWPLMLDSLAAGGVENLVFGNGIFSAIADAPDKHLQVAKLMADAGMKFVDGHAQFAPGSTLVAPDEFRPMVVANHKLQLETMATFGVKSCCFHIGKSNSYPGLTVEKAADNVRKTLELTLKEAEKLNIVICLENIFHPLNTTSFLLELMRDFASPCLGVCFDCGHANIMEKHMPQSVMYSSWAACGKNADEIEWDENSLEKLIPHIIMCHLHDNNGVTDQHLLPGEGTVDFDAVFAGLEKAPRLLSYQSETLPLKNQITGRKLGKTWLEFLKKY